MRKVIGKLEWSGALPETMTYGQAEKYAEQVGEGWRLPTPAELLSLWDYSTGTCPEFPVTEYEERTSYWTSAVFGPWTSWFFDRGMINRSNHSAEHKVILVREVAA